MNYKTFLKALSSELYPKLRSEGFRGSGNTLRRIDDPVVHVFNAQGESGGGCCFLNLGAHLLFLPASGLDVAVPKTLKEYECAFRDRYDPPAGSPQGWSFGNNENETLETVAFITEHWEMYAHPFYEKHSGYPEGFKKLLSKIDTTTEHPTNLLIYARISKQLGNREQTKQFVRPALERCPPRATGLRHNLQVLLESSNGG